MTTATIFMNFYRAVMPLSVRQSKVLGTLKSYLKHDWIYNSDYYATTVEGPAVASAGRISETILHEFRPRSVIDVGCGTGALLEALKRKNVEVTGLEYSEAALKYCRKRNLAVAKFNLEKDTLGVNNKFDVAVSMEVAEHLPPSVADRYVKLLSSLAPIVVFTAAHPGQGGSDHVNEQPPSYWIAKFKNNGFEYDSQRSELLRAQWKAAGNVESWYHENLMIFRQSDGSSHIGS